MFFDNKPAQKDAWTKDIWIYDYRTHVHHTLKKKPKTMDHLEDFVKCYNPDNRHDRTETWNAKTNPAGRWRKYARKDVLARDKTSLDIFG